MAKVVSAVLERAGTRGGRCLLGALLVLATVAAYGPALQAGFIWDDDDYVTANPLLHEADGLWRIWFSADAPSQYFPLVYSAFRLEYALWGLDPFGYHLVNVLFHAANALLVWWLLGRLRLPGAGLAAAIFALHPVHVESVAWITERKNVLSLFFMLCSLGAWLRFATPGAFRRRQAYAAALACHALALFAKTTAVTLPAAQLAVLWLRDGRVTARRLWQVLPFALLGTSMGLVTVWWERAHQGTLGERFALPLLDSLLVASRAVWFYLGKLVWPVSLSFSYPKFEIDPTNPVAYVWTIAGGALLWLLWRLRARTGPGPLVATLIFVGMLSPMLGFIPLFTFLYSYVADHYQYTASLGPIALFAAGAARAAARGRLPTVARASGAACLLAVLAVLTFSQSRAYESRETLWRDVISVHPASWMAHTNLGREMLRQKRIGEAEAAYRRATEIDPGHPVPQRGLGLALRRLGRLAEAETAFAEAVRLKPDFLPGLRDLAHLRRKRGDLAGARIPYRAIVGLASGAGDVRIARLQLARIDRALGDRTSAEAGFRTLLDRDPDDAPVLVGLARLLSDCDEPVARLDEASALATRAVRIAGEGSPVALAALARVEARLYGPEVALSTARRGLAQASGAAAERLQRQLAGYERGETPCEIAPQSAE